MRGREGVVQCLNGGLYRVLPTLVGSGRAQPPLSTERPPLTFLRPVHTVQHSAVDSKPLLAMIDAHVMRIK